MARTQQQRREDTIARLLDASIATIIEVGYARASAKVIAQRAEVSDGALFRHFPTMSDFMAATAEEAGRRLIELGLRKVAEIPGGKPTLEQALTILRDVTVDPTNTVMYELAVAARTDEKLRDTLRDVMTLYIKTIQETVRPSLPEEFEAAGDAEFLARLALVLSSFNGAALFGHVLTEPGFGEAQIPLLMRLLNAARP
ncbi:TetR family transcriptional regulator [Mycolicibacterium agri]|uniref:TetR family transcriptional regulator n=1 Tax=Mycolicibacterium agri TaxID=36811 RepID=A0A2A7N3V0_MYCAG|nr:TetR/AcrR family transcriptional regulator [Mycolicibacterium agri]PEG38427.1 TetR family transcriptional regulator [Mycolicibacterium agri]GFG53876.1 TetR family transcriptional regulator [Mycolicibacterium agri]